MSDKGDGGVVQLIEGHGDVVAAALREGLNRYSKNRPDNVSDEDLAVLRELAKEVRDL